MHYTAEHYICRLKPLSGRMRAGKCDFRVVQSIGAQSVLRRVADAHPVGVVVQGAICLDILHGRIHDTTVCSGIRTSQSISLTLLGLPVGPCV